MSDTRKKLRKELRRAEGGQADQMASAEPDPEELAFLRERAAFVEELLGELPEGSAAVLRLYYLESVAPDEIASRLGLSLNAVYSRMHRGREAIAAQVIAAAPDLANGRRARAVIAPEAPAPALRQPPASALRQPPASASASAMREAQAPPTPTSRRAPMPRRGEAPAPAGASPDWVAAADILRAAEERRLADASRAEARFARARPQSPQTPALRRALREAAALR